MNYILNLLNSTRINIIQKRFIFLLCSVLASSLIGFILWYIIHFFILNKLVYLFCFVGYFGIFIGLFGGLLFLYNFEKTI